MTTASKPLRVADRPVEQSAGTALDYGSLEEAFPAVDCGFTPFGDKIVVQVRTAMKRTKGGIFVPEESRETEQWNTQVAKVIAIGPVAFCNRDTLQPWPEKAWCAVGDYVRVPLYGGDRWHVPVPGSADPALFAVFRDVDLVGKVPENRVLETVAWIPLKG